MVSRNRKLNELIPPNTPNRREKEAEFMPKLVAYTNAEAHSAIEKACKIVMITIRLVKPDPSDFGLTGALLEHDIKKDLEKGNIPFHVHGSLGTTNSCAIDKLNELADVVKKFVFSSKLFIRLIFQIQLLVSCGRGVWWNGDDLSGNTEEVSWV
jgi:glutamate/tyrosine decarboxylase-like PLP-dependent enzyme